MSVRSLQDQVDSLLNKSVVQPKVGGVASPDVETASVIESLALAMMLQPRSAFYAYYLARNGLTAAINSEVAAIDALKITIQDLSNNTFAIKDTKALKRAQAAMLQLSTQGQVSSDSSAFDRYSVAVDDFLNKQLSKNVKKPNSTEMVRPGEEASLALPTDLATVKSTHSTFLDRLYALAVGITNFANTPFSSLVGANAVYRTKKDLDSLVEEIEADESGSQSRDAAVRLIAGRAAVRMLGASIDLHAPVIDTVRHLPPDQLLSGESPATPATAATAAGPFVMAPGGSLSMTVGGVSLTSFALSQAGNAAAILGDAVSFPVLVPANYHLFLRLEAISGLTWTPGGAGTTEAGTFSETTLGSGWTLDGAGTYFKTFKVVLNSGSPTTTPAGSAVPLSMSLANVLAAINTALGAVGSAQEFVGAGSSRILIYGDTKVQRLAITLSSFTMETQSLGFAGATGATVLLPRLYTNSFHSSLGFSAIPVGEAGSTPADRILQAMQLVFPSLVSFSLGTDGRIAMTTFATGPGTALSFSGSWAGSLGLSASYQATSTTVILKNELGVASPLGLLDVGDSFTCSSGTATVVSVRTDSFEVASALPTFSGPITVTSALLQVWQFLDGQVQAFLGPWIDGKYAIDLSLLDQLVAVLIGSPTSPRRAEAIALLDDLRAQLVALKSSLTGAGAVLLGASATKEKAALNNVISLFTERKYDRALDLLLQCKLQEIFELDWQSVSYSGALMKAAEGVAQADVKFPDLIQDEGFDVQGRRELVR